MTGENMAHMALLGDSVFDNRGYVPPGAEVVHQLQARLGDAHRATLLAQDGSVLADMPGQLDELRLLREPATHLVVSCGGNDVLALVGAMQSPVRSVLDAADLLATWQTQFRQKYRSMLDHVLACDLPAAVSTIYDAVPGLTPGLRCALSLFNDVIVREAATRGVPVLDLRLVCADAEDYSPVSPIEPSDRGAGKIASALAHLLLHFDVDASRTTIHRGATSGHIPDLEASSA
jgi:hypothetical protein